MRVGQEAEDGTETLKKWSKFGNISLPELLMTSADKINGKIFMNEVQSSE